MQAAQKSTCHNCINLSEFTAIQAAQKIQYTLTMTIVTDINTIITNLNKIIYNKYIKTKKTINFILLKTENNTQLTINIINIKQ